MPDERGENVGGASLEARTLAEVTLGARLRREEIPIVVDALAWAIDNLAAKRVAVVELELRRELERVRQHNIQLLRRKPKHSCIEEP